MTATDHPIGIDCLTSLAVVLGAPSASRTLRTFHTLGAFRHVDVGTILNDLLDLLGGGASKVL